MQEMNEIEPDLLPGGGRGVTLDFKWARDRDDRMWAKIKTQGPPDLLQTSKKARWKQEQVVI